MIRFLTDIASNPYMIVAAYVFAVTIMTINGFKEE